MPTIVGILTFMSMINIVLSWVEHEKSVITSGPGYHIVLNTADTRHTVIPWRIELFHIGIVCLLLWPISSPQRSLGHSLFKQKFSQKFVGFFLRFFFSFFILSKFPNSHSLVYCSSMSETSNDRKKERKQIVIVMLYLNYYTVKKKKKWSDWNQGHCVAWI